MLEDLAVLLPGKVGGVVVRRCQFVLKLLYNVLER